MSFQEQVDIATAHIEDYVKQLNAKRKSRKLPPIKTVEVDKMIAQYVSRMPFKFDKLISDGSELAAHVFNVKVRAGFRPSREVYYSALDLAEKRKSWEEIGKVLSYYGSSICQD